MLGQNETAYEVTEVGKKGIVNFIYPDSRLGVNANLTRASAPTFTSSSEKDAVTKAYEKWKAA